MKGTFPAYAALFSITLASAASNFGVPGMGGSLRVLLSSGSASEATKTIAPSQFQPGMGPGKVVDNVNVFSGQPIYSVPIGALSARGSVSFPITLNYGGPTRPLVESDNERGPVGWVGLGFSLSVPFVAVNHKGTYTTSDDVLYCNLGPYGGGQILQASSGAFFLSTNPYIKISTNVGTTGEFAGQFLNWTFQMPDGTKLVFGQSSNSQRTVFYNNNVIKASPFAVTPSQRYIYRWDIGTLSDFSGANKIQFEYEQLFEDAGQSRQYVRESQVSKISWLGPNSQNVESYEFVTQSKGAGEYHGYAAGEPKDDQRLYETRYLDQINCRTEGTVTRFFKFIRDVKPDWEGRTSKPLLKEIQLYHYDQNRVLIKDNGWQFGYEAISKYYLLNSIVTPNLRTDKYVYKAANLAGKDGDQAWGPDVMLRQDHKTPIALPSDKTKLAKWKNDAKCDDRFCYMIVKDGDDIADENGWKQKMYVEIRPNMGNYFDTASATAVKRFENGTADTPIEDLDVIPGGDYFLVVNYKYGSIDLWEWNGIKLTKQAWYTGDARYNGNFGHRIAVYPGGNYFLVHKTSVSTSSTVPASAAEVIVVMRKADGTWTTLNKNPSACEIANSANYGENIRPSTPKHCMEFSNDKLMITTAPSFFTISHRDADIMLLYGLNKDGNGFTNMTAKLPVVPGANQRAGFPMNWDENLDQIYSTDKYLAISSYTGTSTTTHYITVLYYNGDSMMVAGSLRPSSEGPFNMFLSDDYFVDLNRDNTAHFWQKKLNASGNVVFERRPTAIPVAAPTEGGEPAYGWARIVRTHPSAFTIEFYKDMDSVGSRPYVNGTNYAVNLYQVDRSFAEGYANRTSNLTWNGQNIFNISFSATDNQMFGMTGRGASGSCKLNDACTFAYYSIRTHPGNTTQFVNLATDVSPLAFPAATKVMQTQETVNGSRLAVRSALRSDLLKVQYQPYQWAGWDFGTPTSHYVVDKFTSSAGLGSLDRDNLTFQFSGDKSPVWRVEFNSNLQSPQFEVCEVKQTNSANGDIGGMKSVFNLDVLGKPLYGQNANLIGVEKNTTSFGAAPDTTVRVDIVSQPYQNASWPAALYVNHLLKRTTKEIASNQSYRTTDVTYHRYNDQNGSPYFIFRPNSMVNPTTANAHSLTQVLFDSRNLPVQSISYSTSNVNDTAGLNGANVGIPLKGQSAYSATTFVPVASSRVQFTSNFLLQKSETWRDVDQNLTEAGMASGNAPVFNLNENWVQTSEVLPAQRNAYDQVVEQRSYDSGPQKGEMFTSFFYEGRRSDLIGTVSNSKLSNCAILTGENGSSGTGLDYAGRWSNPGVSFDSKLAHTGRYSMKVTDHYGPTINIYLKDAVQSKYSYKVSAWVYARPGVTPVMAVERHPQSGAASTFYGSPVDGYVLESHWARWEAVIPNADLVAGGLAWTGADYLRIWVGTGEPTGNAGNAINVDDIVCLPGNASYGLSSFDARGIATSSTNGDHIATYYDLGIRGDIMAARDDRYRIHGQTGSHKMGEN